MHSSGVWAPNPPAEISAVELRDWQGLLEARAGIVLGEQQRRFLQNSLSARMRELGIDNYASYYRRVVDGPRGAVEWTFLLDRLTVQETAFFRHPASFELLRRYLQGRVSEGRPPQPWAFWSLGCASGEEPYSLAITAMDVLNESAAVAAEGFGVTATDISLSALERLRRGAYPPRRLERLDEGLRQRYFSVQADGDYKVLPSLAERVCGARLNVLDLARAPMVGMDIIFCQNLLIYFRRWRRREILNRLAERLAPGGLLVIGVGEMAGWQHPALEPVADPQVLAFIRKG